jgi:hypothetical protein
VTDSTRRKELVAQYKRDGAKPGVFRIVNRRTNQALLGSTANLGSVRGKLDFARATNNPGALSRSFRPLNDDLHQFGLEAFDLEILEVLEVTPEMSALQVREDLAALEALWRERFDPATLY